MDTKRVKRILRLLECMEKRISLNKTARKLHLGRSTVYRFWLRQRELELTLEQAKEMSSEALIRLFNHQKREGDNKVAIPYEKVYYLETNLDHPKNLRVIWKEYAENAGKNAYRFPQFYHLYKKWKSESGLPYKKPTRQSKRVFIDLYGQVHDAEALCRLNNIKPSFSFSPFRDDESNLAPFIEVDEKPINPAEFPKVMRRHSHFKKENILKKERGRPKKIITKKRKRKKKPHQYFEIEDWNKRIKWK